MADEGFITAGEAADAAGAAAGACSGQPTPERSIAPYFVEDIRKVLEQKYGAKALYESGLTVQTTLDVDSAGGGQRALDRGLRRVDKRRTASASRAERPRRRATLETFTTDRWARPILAGDIVPAVVTIVTGRQRQPRACASAPASSTCRAPRSPGREGRRPPTSSRSAI